MSATRGVRLACEAVAFDVDGVLVDSRLAVEALWREWASQRGVDLELVLSAAHGWRTVDTIRRVAPYLDVEREAVEVERREVAQTDGVAPVPGAHDLLLSLPAPRWAAVTSGTSALAHARLRSAGLPVPAILVTADDVERGKPDPGGYLDACARLGVSPSAAIAFEDAPVGIRAAKAAGMTVVGIATTHAPGDLAAADVLLADLRSVRAHDVDAPRLSLSMTPM